MKKQINPNAKAHLIRRAFYVLLFLAVCAIHFALGHQSAVNSGVDPAKMSLAGRISSISEACEAQGSPTPVPEATAVVVWDQYNNAGTAVTLSATFTDYPAMNSDLADDFVVPAGYAWMVRWIDVDGSYVNGPGFANTFSVVFYSDNDGFPVSQIYATLASWEQNGSTFRVHVCDNPPCPSVIYPGTYWVEIQANMTAMCCGEWGWTDRTVTDLNAAVWRNPSGFFGACTSWGRRGATCGLDPSAPDQVYRIYAEVIPVCSVDSSNLGCGGTINFQATEFNIHMGSCPVDPATVHTSSFTVNNIQPNSFTLLNNNTTISFHYNTTPVVPGQNTMHVPAGGFNCVCGPVLEFTCTFTYQAPTPTPTPTCIPGGTPGPWTEAAVYPAAVYGAAVASNGANIYAFGGNTAGGAQHAEAYRYDPIANSWTALASMTTGPDYLFHAEYGGNGKIYVMGGQNGGTLNRIYDITTNTWSAGAPVPECVNDYGHAYYNGKVYVIGGWACGAASSTVYAYDVASNTWSAPLAPLPQTELNMATAAINGKIYVANGLYCHDQPPVCDTINNLFIYDIAGNSWTSAPPSPLASEYPAGTAIEGKFYMIGGSGANTYLYDPVANSWSDGPSLLIPRYFADAATALLPAVQTAVVVGGHNQGFSLNSVETSSLGGCPSQTPTATPTWTVTATPTATPTATATFTPTPTPVVDVTGTPRPRPTPAPRPQPHTPTPTPTGTPSPTPTLSATPRVTPRPRPGSASRTVT